MNGNANDPAERAISCALACENIMLAACSFGLGSCYVAFGSMVKEDVDVVQTLELKDDERIYGPIVWVIQRKSLKLVRRGRRRKNSSSNESREKVGSTLMFFPRK